jgi:hypothetical protein
LHPVDTIIPKFKIAYHILHIEIKPKNITQLVRMDIDIYIYRFKEKLERNKGNLGVDGNGQDF